MTDVAAALILVVVAIVASRIRNLGLESELVVSVLRAIVQLGVVATIIQIVFDRLGLSGLFLVVMLAAAAVTSARRLSGVPGAPWLAATTIGVSAVVAMAVLFGTGVFPFEPQFLIPIGGMLIGNSMTAVSLAGSRLRDELIDKILEIEARLALGVSVRRALRPYTATSDRHRAHTDNRFHEERRPHLPSWRVRRNDAGGGESGRGGERAASGAVHAAGSGLGSGHHHHRVGNARFLRARRASHHPGLESPETSGP